MYDNIIGDLVLCSRRAWTHTFSGVIGCVDGTHIRLQRPSQNEADYVNRKGYHSVNVLFVTTEVRSWRYYVITFWGRTC